MTSRKIFQNDKLRNIYYDFQFLQLPIPPKNNLIGGIGN